MASCRLWQVVVVPKNRMKSLKDTEITIESTGASNLLKESNVAG